MNNNFNFYLKIINNIFLIFLFTYIDVFFFKMSMLSILILPFLSISYFINLILRNLRDVYIIKNGCVNFYKKYLIIILMTPLFVYTVAYFHNQWIMNEVIKISNIKNNDKLLKTYFHNYKIIHYTEDNIIIFYKFNNIKQTYNILEKNFSNEIED